MDKKMLMMAIKDLMDEMHQKMGEDGEETEGLSLAPQEEEVPEKPDEEEEVAEEEEEEEDVSANFLKPRLALKKPDVTLATMIGKMTASAKKKK